MSPQPRSYRVVITPEMFGRSFFDRDCARVLELWRDGKITPVLNRELLVRYLRTLSGLGLSEGLVRRWAWWWNAADKTHFISAGPPAPCSTVELCSWLASTGSARRVVQSGFPYSPPIELADAGPKWCAAEPFVDEFAARQT